MDRQAQAKALRLRLYVLCSECARLIDLADDNKPQRMVEAADLFRHEAEDHAKLVGSARDRRCLMREPAGLRTRIAEPPSATGPPSDSVTVRPRGAVARSRNYPALV